MYLAELQSIDGHYVLGQPLKLVHEKKYHQQTWQKNWLPFEWSGILLMSYALNPHEVLLPNLVNGLCYPVSETMSYLQWNLGPMRGGSPPLHLDGEYLAFFHSGMPMSSPVSYGYELWHFFMGAYTFSDQPPLQSPRSPLCPLLERGFMLPPIAGKKLVCPEDL